MKKLHYIWLFCLLLLSQWIAAGTQLVSADKNWLGGNPAFNTTEGNDFWLTFMTNNATDVDNASLHFVIYAVADTAAQIIVEAGGSQIGTITIPAGGGIGKLDNISAQSVYIEAKDSETQQRKGVHVYSQNKGTPFSCYALAEAGSGNNSTRDASLILPTRVLDKEYFIQTYQTDGVSTEFAVIATENGTRVTITPKAQTSKSKPAGTPITLTLSKGMVYLVRSALPSEVENIDMSGSTICANKPVAVFQGNEAVKIASGNTGAYSVNHAFEQTLPASRWGKEFYLSLTEHAIWNFYNIVAAYNETTITISGWDSPLQLNAGETLEEALSLVSSTVLVEKDVKITSDKPIMVSTYLSCGGANQEIERVNGKTVTNNWGNSTSAMMPAWEMRVNHMSFYTDTIAYDTKATSSGHMYVQVLTKSTDTGTFTLDGTAVPASAFTALTVDGSMAVANIELTTEGKHTLESSGSGFVGFVYAITSEARAYQYTLGYCPEPHRDSLFINNSETLMSIASYDMDSLDGHGWYQRQWKEWIKGRLDTAIVCDSSYVYWTIETPAEREVQSINWNLYDVTGGKRKAVSDDIFPREDNPSTGTNHTLTYQFILPEEPMENRKPFFDYELEIILHRDPIICEDNDIGIDTFRTVTRVTRIYNDTIWRVICIGDSLDFFKDSLFCQGDLTQFQAGEKKETKFRATHDTNPNDVPFEWRVDAGQYTFQRTYLSQFGCDSLMTLELYVCDTFRFVDTIHLCSNQDTLYHDMYYRGYDFIKPKGGTPYTRITKDTTVQFRKFKTKFCGCQLGDLKDRYKTKDGKSFGGCDSIYELHLFIHKSYDLHVTDTMRYDVQTDSIYHWLIERNGVHIDSLISLKDTVSGKLRWSSSAQAWIGNFADTLYTKTCSECNEGQHGCDSINSLKLIIPKVYHFYDTVTWCRIHYDWSKHDVTYQDFCWTGHHNDIIYTSGGDYVDSHVSRYGADSIYYLHLVYSQAPQPLYDKVKETVCLDTIHRTRNWTSSDGIINTDTIPQDKVGLFYFVDESRCDTIYEYKLRVLPTYYKVDEHIMSQEEVFTWYANGQRYGGPKTELEYDSLITTPLTTIYHYKKTKLIDGVECDSTHVLILRMGNVYRDTIQAYACGNDNQFIWTENRPEYYKNGVPFIRKTITNLPAMGTNRIYEDRYTTTAGFDSVFYVNLYRAFSHDSTDTYRICQATGATFDWPRHIGHTTIYDQYGNSVSAIPAERYGYYEYTDRLLTDSFKCDSIWHLRLYVDSVYHYDYYGTGCQGREYIWEDQDIDSIDRPINTVHTGDYTYTASYHTIHGCDSTWTLHLHIDTAYTVPVSVTDTFMCDKDSLVFIDRVIYGSKSPNKPATEPGIVIPEGELFTEVDLNGSVPSSLGCDSAVQYHLVVYRTYSDTTRLRLCQPSEGRDSLYHWTDHDTVWDVHNGRYIPADSIPRYVKGDTTYLYIDSLRTTFCKQCDQNRQGCDSLFYLFLTIDSTYHFYDTVHICENEYYEWQEIRFIGDSLPETERLTTDSVLAPGTYSMRVHHQGVHTCDSIYYLELYIHPVYYTYLTDTLCDNDTRHVYEFSDTKNNYFRDSVSYQPHSPVDDKDTATTHYEIQHQTLQHTLKTVDGCDSIVRMDITILPTYEFVAKGKGCFGDIIPWRGQFISASGIYFDSLTTADGCDSVFVLEFLVKPVLTTYIYDTICEDAPYIHRDTIWYPDGRISVFEQEVWTPGTPRPKPYTEVTFKSADGNCDSIIYRYYLTIRDTFTFHTQGLLCSNDTFYSAELDHAWERTAYEYDTNVYVLPFDTVLIDSLTTQHGCDSLYFLHAHVLPAYRHIEYDTICGNESLLWHDSLLHDLDFGLHYIRDSFLTENECDSIFELRLYVQPKYYTEEIATICADESYSWRGRLIEHLEVGENHLFYDSLFSMYGCDSVFHLYLTVLDTTYEERFDTMCYGDTLFVTETGHFYTQAGDYKDTTENEWGCRHFIYSHYEQIAPTVPTVWAEDPMCQSESAFDLYYTYTSRAPLSYSLYFDSVGLSMGFENMIDVPITDYTDPMVITIPIPYRGDDPTQYPRPNNYGIRLVLDNGICQHMERDCFRDSTFMMSYPKWITEQRFGDLIAILNSKYNGGYEWEHYQWYCDDSLLVGQTKEYLYIPRGLDVGAQYHVRLTRIGETEEFPTCPITIIANPIKNDYAPSMSYLSVVPTYVVAGYPVVSILSRKDGTYRVTHGATGALVKEGVFHADVTEVELPAVVGVYIFQLWSDDTPEEPYRNIKVMVGN